MPPRLPEHLLAGLKHTPSDRPVHLLTRHSIREQAVSGFASYDLNLTPEGIILAQEYGSVLPRRVASCYSSPVARCVDTGTAMLNGAGLDFLVETNSTLVEPGCYVTNLRRAGRMFMQTGVRRFINHHLQQEARGVLTPAEGRQKLLNYLFLRQPPAGQLAIHITHDTILAAFVAGLRDARCVLPPDWPAMMEGVWLWFGERRIHWVWRDQPGSRPWHGIH